jgi:hypothetical protein
VRVLTKGAQIHLSSGFGKIVFYRRNERELIEINCWQLLMRPCVYSLRSDSWSSIGLIE